MLEVEENLNNIKKMIPNEVILFLLIYLLNNRLYFQRKQKQYYQKIKNIIQNLKNTT